MNPKITGIGWVCPDGIGRGRDGSPFDWKPGPLPKLHAQSIFGKPFRHFGRMDAYSKAGLAAIAMALTDARLDTWTHKRPMGIVAGTVHGCLQTDDDYYRTVLPEQGALASPNLFAYTLPNTYLGNAAIYFGLTGPAVVVNESGAPGMTALILAMDHLILGEVEQILCGFCDTGVTDMDPLGEPGFNGALFMVLESRPQDPETVYGRLALTDQSRILFNSQVVSDFFQLVSWCRKEVAHA